MSPRSSAHADGIPTDGCSAVSDSRGPPRARNGLRLCENTSVQVLMRSPSEQRRPNPSSSPDCSYQCGSAEDSDCPFQVVGEDVEAHLGCDVGQLSCSEVGPPHPIP